ncbi:MULTISPECIES: PfkB family carbohydrate kinase [unclassified Pseudomonas]|uniref:PfkB family carbohydrate kinase n=1 Tax=unclassified Pseudomonas TaxID=196821 RepID=UPI000C868E8B|nr:MULTISPECIES: PfkB family carbohydrate kinase [unclassified Pseudomonas]PMV86392.1 sugar kinase [Pseudomonas sp. GW101-1A09]PMV95581.1 sugar kinase [Pseudomonas sp. GW460-C8]PMV97543.1 sugar kinase [Pseudomonas sp. FW306-2-2C-B10A]PMW04894.1 sugar kinase [Pseudomonas sp. MPR-TSA4]PMW13138.1 sugar kinase [Pseudomonas sp. FW306-2-1A-C05A]
MPRLLHTGQVIIDLVMAVDKLPQPGGDVLAQSASFEAGGGFNVMAAAARNGLPVVYLGRHGTGRFGDLAREAMKTEGIQLGIAHKAERDTGLCVAVTDASAERSFISYIGAEGELTTEDLASVLAEAGDYVYVSGYSLLHVGKAQALLDWVLGLPKVINVVFDPGPLVDSPDAPLMQALLPRIDLWTSNSVEALRFTGAADIAEALDRLTDHLPAEVLMVVRDGPQGCWISQRGEREHMPGFKVEAVDSNGAGDAHAGVFLAGLARGLSASEAARRANAAAALAVTRWGPATSPGTAEVDALIRKTFGA